MLLEPSESSHFIIHLTNAGNIQLFTWLCLRGYVYVAMHGLTLAQPDTIVSRCCYQLRPDKLYTHIYKHYKNELVLTYEYLIN